MLTIFYDSYVFETKRNKRKSKKKTFLLNQSTHSLFSRNRPHIMVPKLIIETHILIFPNHLCFKAKIRIRNNNVSGNVTGKKINFFYFSHKEIQNHFCNQTMMLMKATNNITSIFKDDFTSFVLQAIGIT